MHTAGLYKSFCYEVEAVDTVRDCFSFDLQGGLDLFEAQCWLEGFLASTSREDYARKMLQELQPVLKLYVGLEMNSAHSFLFLQVYSFNFLHRLDYPFRNDVPDRQFLQH